MVGNHIIWKNNHMVWVNSTHTPNQIRGMGSHSPDPPHSMVDKGIVWLKEKIAQDLVQEENIFHISGPLILDKEV